MATRTDQLKGELLSVLAHQEAEEGLFLRNILHVHEDDDRAAVDGKVSEVVAALNELVSEGKVALDALDEEIVFRLA